MTFRSKLLLSHAVIAVITVATMVLLLNRTLGEELTHALDERLEQQAQGAVEWVSTGRHPERIASRLGPIVDARVTIFDATGRVLGDSEPPADEEAAEALARAEAPEVRAALANRVGKALRADERGRQMRFVAVPGPQGTVIRLGVPLTGVVDTLGDVRRRLLVATVIGCVAALVLGLLAAWLAARPLRAMRDAATRIAAGDYAIEVSTTSRDDFGDLARALASMAAQLEERIATLRRLEIMRRDFVANVSHELRTPVTAIAGYAETLLAGKADETTQREFLATIHRNAGRLGSLVDDLLVLADLEARPPGTTAREAVPVAPIAEAVARTARPAAEERRVSIRVEADAGAVVVGDAVALEQVLQNLVENAVKYGKSGGSVTVRAARAGDRVTINVSDDGPGIPPEHLPRIFERFYRVDAGRSRDRGGTGLGLAIVKHLVEAMDGTVRAESQVGSGSRFVVDLPAFTSAR